ncbi:MAG: hypothetical protein PHI16_03805 [Methanocellales archaeon]|nr:hypothetical protein [Methanocellales archaeon]
MKNLKDTLIDFIPQKIEYKLKKDFKLLVFELFVLIIMLLIYLILHECLHALGCIIFGVPFCFGWSGINPAVYFQTSHTTKTSYTIICGLPLFSSILGVPFLYFKHLRHLRFLGFWWIGTSFVTSLNDSRLVFELPIKSPILLMISVVGSLLWFLSLFDMLNNEWVDGKFYEFFQRLNLFFE